MLFLPLGTLILGACEGTPPASERERPPSCMDGQRNGQETDVDCGGICVPCAVGRLCQTAKDCTSGVCLDGRCAAPSCTDGVRNGGEVDKDCGGPCGPCPEGRTCGSAADCRSGVCRLDRCVPATCADQVQNGDESDRDCGGSCARCAVGRLCRTDADCHSGRCSEGRCACVVHSDCAPAGMNCNGGTCGAALESCAAQRALYPSSGDGEYWIKPGAQPIRAYCDMQLGAALCTEEQAERRGRTREGGALPFVAVTLLQPDAGVCELWAIRHPDNGYPYGRLYQVAGQALNTCRAFGFQDDGAVSSCPFGAMYGDCGYGVDYYRYGNRCSGCGMNDGQYATFVLQGRMYTANVLTDRAGTIRLRCKTR